MKIHVKEALLSAFVFPGLGQLFKGNRLKGLIIIGSVNILLAILFYLVLRQLAPLIFSAQKSGSFDTTNIIERLHTGSPVISYLLSAFCGLWLYSWIDAAVGKRGPE
jgi:hypothetical protein